MHNNRNNRETVIIPQTIIVLIKSIIVASLGGNTANRAIEPLKITAWEIPSPRQPYLGEHHNEWTEAGVSVSRVTMLRRFEEKGNQATSETITRSEASYVG